MSLAHGLADGTQSSNSIPSALDVTGSNRCFGFEEFSDCNLVAQQLKWFLQAVHVVRADQDSGRASVPSDHDSIVFSVDSINELGESVPRRRISADVSPAHEPCL